MDKLISRNAAIKAMLNEQQEDIKAYGCSIPECFDGDRASRVLMQLPYIDTDMFEYSDRLWKLPYERGKNDGSVRCKNCKYYDWTWVDKLERNNNHYCPIIDCVTDVEFFCSKGERITDETN